MKGIFDSSTVVINPRRYPKAVSRLEKLLAKVDASHVVVSQSKEDFIENVANFYHSDNQNILVWGGDGTAHDAINTLVNSAQKDDKIDERKRKSIGFLRGGSGNGIQDSYEVPHDYLNTLEKQIQCYAESIENGYNIDVDLIEAQTNGDSLYCQLAGFGFDVEVLKKREGRRFKKGKLAGEAKTGMSNYFLSTVSAFLQDFHKIDNRFHIELRNGKNVMRGPQTNAEIKFDEVSRDITAPLIELGTRPYYGRSFKICPDVVCNDGFLDIYFFNFENKFDALTNLPWIYSGKHKMMNRKFAKKDKPPIERYQVKEVTFSSDSPFQYHIDGELKNSKMDNNGDYKISFRVVPEAINFLVPKSFYRAFHWFGP